MIGQITLNLSFGLYLFFLWPQIFHNALRKSTQELSLSMHLILFVAYLSDLVYGVGRQMPWQYKLVTLSGLICLSIQQLQFNLYAKKSFRFINIFVLICALFCLYALFAPNLPKGVFIYAGIISQLGWLLYALPQIYRNAKESSVVGLNFYFVFLAFIITICDTISAWSLHWDWPSKIGSPLSLLLKLILLFQFAHYSKTKK